MSPALTQHTPAPTHLLLQLPALAVAPGGREQHLLHRPLSLSHTRVSLPGRRRQGSLQRGDLDAQPLDLAALLLHLLNQDWVGAGAAAGVSTVFVPLATLDSVSSCTTMTVVLCQGTVPRQECWGQQCRFRYILSFSILQPLCMNIAQLAWHKPREHRAVRSP